MKKYFVFSDIHGFYNELMTSLIKEGFEKNNKDHIIISCGDLMDRGNNPRECLKFVNDLYKKNRAILIKGNHETLMEEMLDRGYPERYDFSNGTVNTVIDMFPSCTDTDKLWEAMKYDEDWNFYRNNLINYYETENYIFTHGFIPLKLNDDFSFCYDEDWRNREKECEPLYWDEYPDGARWLNGIKMNHDGLNKTGKTIVCGHYHCSYGWSHIKQKHKEFPPKTHKDFLKSFQPYKEDGIIAIDACTAYSGIVNVITL